MSVASTLDLSPYAAAQHLSILCLDFVECRTLTPACSTTPLDAHRHSDGHGTLDELRVVTPLAGPASPRAACPCATEVPRSSS